MNKRELSILERAFDCEVRAGISGGLGIFQTKNKLALKLVAEGFLQKEKVVLPGRFSVTVEGYTLTHAGRLIYCASC